MIIEEIAMLIFVLCNIFLFLNVFHIDISISQGFLPCFLLPLLFKEFWILGVDGDLDVGIFLDQNNTIVEVTVHKGDDQRSVAVDIFAL